MLPGFRCEVKAGLLAQSLPFCPLVSPGVSPDDRVGRPGMKRHPKFAWWCPFGPHGEEGSVCESLAGSTLQLPARPMACGPRARGSRGCDAERLLGEMSWFISLPPGTFVVGAPCRTRCCLEVPRDTMQRHRLAYGCAKTLPRVPTVEWLVVNPELIPRTSLIVCRRPVVSVLARTSRARKRTRSCVMSTRSLHP